MANTSIKFLKWVVAILGCGIILVAATLAVIVAFDISVNLDFMDPELEATASRLIGRKVTIGGPIRLKPSLRPILEVHNIGIANPDQWESGEFLQVEKAVAQIEILPFIQGKIRIDELLFDSVTLVLASQPDGRVNWQFDRPLTEDKGRKEPRQFPELERITLRNFHIRYQDRLKDRKI